MRISDWSSDVCSSDLTGRPTIMSNEKDLETINGRPLHSGVRQLCAQYQGGKMDRREFVRLAAFLGVSADPAYACAGDPLGGGLVKEAAAESSDERRVGKEGVSTWR